MYESYPGLPGEDRWERLISENGQPRAASDLEREMRDRQKKAEALAREVAQQPARLQARQQREYAEQRREFDAVIDDVFLVYNIRMERRESLNGHETIVFSLTPRPHAKPRTREGGQMRRFTVRAWISESDRELVRVDAEAIETAVDGLRPARPAAQGREAVVPANEGEQRGVAPLASQLRRQRAGRPRRRIPSQRHVRVFAIPEVLGRYLDHISAADAVAADKTTRASRTASSPNRHRNRRPPSSNRPPLRHVFLQPTHEMRSRAVGVVDVVFLRQIPGREHTSVLLRDAPDLQRARRRTGRRTAASRRQ